MSERQWSISVKDSNGDTSPYAPMRSFNLVGVVPTLLTPADNSDADGTSFTWDHQGQGGAQEEFAFRRKTSSYIEDYFDVEQLENPFSDTTEDTGDVEVSPDGKKILWLESAGGTRAELYSLEDWTLLKDLVADGVLSSESFKYFCSWSPDGEFVFICTNEGGYLFDTSDWSTALFVDDNARRASFSGGYLVVATLNSPRIWIYDVGTWTRLATSLVMEHRTHGGNVSPDGTLLAVGFYTWVENDKEEGLRVYNTSDWSVVSGTPTLDLDQTYYRGIPHEVFFTPDGAYLFVGIINNSDKPSLEIFDVATWNSASPPSGFPDLTSGNGIYKKSIFQVRDSDIIHIGWSQLQRQNNNGSVFFNYVTWERLIEDINTTSIDFGVNNIRGCSIPSAGNVIAAVPAYNLQIWSLEDIVEEWWDGTQWVTTETFIISGDESLTLPAGAWDD